MYGPYISGLICQFIIWWNTLKNTWFDVNFFPLESTIRKGDSRMTPWNLVDWFWILQGSHVSLRYMFLSGFFLGALVEIFIEILPNCSEHLPRTPSNLGFFVLTTQADAGPHRPSSDPRILMASGRHAGLKLLFVTSGDHGSWQLVIQILELWMGNFMIVIWCYMYKCWLYVITCNF